MATTTSYRYLTLDEFLDSAAPLPTIVGLPRERALRLLELCELAEMTPSDDFLNSIHNAARGASSLSSEEKSDRPRENNESDDDDDDDDRQRSFANDSDDNNRQRHSGQYVLVTQMALLLHLGEYGHARHLWRRHRGDRRLPENKNENENVSDSSDRVQLEMLWDAARHLRPWDSGGIDSLLASSSSRSQSRPASSGEEEDDDDRNNDNNNDDDDDDAMPVAAGESPENDAKNDDDDLPLSALALRALERCASSGMEPLATYSAELAGEFRDRVDRRLRASFDALDEDEFRLRTNTISPPPPSTTKTERKEKGATGGGGKQMAESLDFSDLFGWRKEGGRLVPTGEEEYDDDEDDALMGANGDFGGKEEDRIGKLTDVVAFLEGRMNA